MEYELQGNGSDGFAIFISEKILTSWHNMKLNVRYKFETLNTQHGATPYESLNPLAANKPWTTKTESQTASK